MTRLCISLLLLMASIMRVSPALATTDSYTIKSVFIHHFVLSTNVSKYKTNDNGIVFCTLGSDPFGTTIDKVAAQSPNNIKLDIKRFIKLPDIDNCQMVFISQSESTKLNYILQRLKDKPILTISEINGFAEQGGMIEFVTTKQNTVQFIINKKIANAAGIKTEVFLLEAAAKVIQ